MRLHQVVDHQHGGMVACAFSHPDDWSAQSQVVWNYQNMSFPVVSYALAHSPDGREAFEFLPAESLYWLQPDYGFCQPGQQTLGQTAMQPMPAADTLVRWILPKYAGPQQQIQITLAGQVPNLAETLNLDLQGLPSEGAAVRFTYAENGIAFEEELFGLQVRQEVPYHGPQGMTLQINWGMARLFRFRAPAGTLDSRRDALWQIAASAKVNPAWEHVCAQVNRQLQQQFDQYIQMGYSQIQAAGQLSRTISANNDAMLAGFQQQRQAAAHTAHSSASSHDSNEAFGEYLRGDRTYEDPYWGENRQDANFDYHWTDGQGTVQSSNDPFFNPNLDANLHGNQNWTLMTPKHP